MDPFAEDRPIAAPRDLWISVGFDGGVAGPVLSTSRAALGSSRDFMMLDLDGDGIPEFPAWGQCVPCSTSALSLFRDSTIPSPGGLAVLGMGLVRRRESRDRLAPRDRRASSCDLFRTF
ncbi:MAG: hypothetical protein KDA28_16545 [Phycisphaerales bacterium]|nr:hypothetical protein [Phycisphaerales bacterium]